MVAPGLPACREASKEDISDIMTGFAGAAGRAKQPGSESVQIHAHEESESQEGL